MPLKYYLNFYNIVKIYITHFVYDQQKIKKSLNKKGELERKN